MSKSDSDQYERVHVPDRAGWRAWLEQNHATATGVWLVIVKKATGEPRVDYAEAVEEALCFGWIDSTGNQLDDERSLLFFAPRRPKSNWSKLNKQRVEKLMAQELMAPAGLAKIEVAKSNGTWNALDAVIEGVIPDDLQAALDAHETAKGYFTAFPPSTKRAILEWILNAKRPETRAKRIEETVRLAADNIRANQWRQP